jgi:hypothetical protein
MYVPPYVPQPIEISGNVAEEPYKVRLSFIRRVSLLHFLTVLIAAAVAAVPQATASAIAAALFLFVILLLLSMVRGLAKGREADQRLSLFLLPILLFAIAVWFRALYFEGWAIWAIGVGIPCALAYVMLCGRDLSFVGMFALALICSSLIITGLCWWLRVSGLSTSAALSLNAVFLFYYVYDLAALLTRRRVGEEWGAVVDLYRDILNGLTYPIRVYHHWKKHNIWAPPKEWFR